MTWYCIVLQDNAWCAWSGIVCVVLRGIKWYCMVLHGIALAFTIMHHLALHHPAPSCTIFHDFAPCCTRLHRTHQHYHSLSLTHLVIINWAHRNYYHHGIFVFLSSGFIVIIIRSSSLASVIICIRLIAYSIFSLYRNIRLILKIYVCALFTNSLLMLPALNDSITRQPG